MSESDFADRYAEEGIAPKAELIEGRKLEGRKQAADRIAGAITKEQIFGLVSLYFGINPPDMS
jgi:hypothetical protein